jgi:hypothetical protein
MLKRRLGVLLSDVRMTADSASLFSGWTMEEILEPVDPQRSQSQINPLQRKLTSGEKSSMLLALKVRIISCIFFPQVIFHFLITFLLLILCNSDI